MSTTEEGTSFSLPFRDRKETQGIGVEKRALEKGFGHDVTEV